jgi:di/tripeptidase
VAAILAALADRELSHPPLEALCTIDEEQGMTGHDRAKNLQPGLVHGTVMLNLDSEEDHCFTIGCVGLECGVIAEIYPGLDMISFGPNIFDPHSEQERASIASSQKFWRLLGETLARL